MIQWLSALKCNLYLNEIEMLKVDGVGETKLKKYGKVFLEAINIYTE